MPYLPSLLKKIDEYYRLSESFQILKRAAPMGAWVSPDNEEPEDNELPSDETETGLYPKIISVANEIASRNTEMYENIAEELQFIGESYKRALEINGGFNEVIMAINRAMGSIFDFAEDLKPDNEDEEDPEVEKAEDILNEMSADLRKRAKNPHVDNFNAAKQLEQVRKDFSANQAREHMESQKQVFEKGKPGQETGHTTGPAPAPAETPKKYILDAQRLQNQLENDPSISSQNPANNNIRNNIKELIETLNALANQIPAVLAAKDKLKLAPDDLEDQESFNKAADLLKQLRSKRSSLKTKLNAFLQNKEKDSLKKRFDESNNPAEKNWLAQKILLQDVKSSTDVGRATEIKYRIDLINSLGFIDPHGDFQALKQNDDLINGLNRGIEYGKDLRKTKPDHDRSLTEQRAIEQGRAIPAKRENQRGGWSSGESHSELTKEIIDPKYFKEVVAKIGPGINTAVSGASYYIAREKEGGYVELHPFIAAVSAAIKKKDDIEKYKAINTLRVETTKYVFKKKQAMISYEIAIRLTPFCRKIEKDAKTIMSWQAANGAWILTDDQSRFVKDFNMFVTRFIEIYTKQYKHQKSNFDSLVINLMPKIKEYIEKVVLGYTYSTGLRLEKNENSGLRYEEPAEEENEEAPKELKHMKSISKFKQMLIEIYGARLLKY